MSSLDHILLMYSSACICGPNPPHRVGVLCMEDISNSDTAKQRFAAG